MGTNFYLYSEPCPTCGHATNRLHIGKSSAGWKFLFHLIPLEDMPEPIMISADNVEKWKLILAMNNVIIKDEYGKAVTPKAFWEMVEEKQKMKRTPTSDRKTTFRELARIKHVGEYDFSEGEFV